MSKAQADREELKARLARQAEAKHKAEVYDLMMATATNEGRRRAAQTMSANRMAVNEARLANLSRRYPVTRLPMPPDAEVIPVIRDWLGLPNVPT